MLTFPRIHVAAVNCSLAFQKLECFRLADGGAVALARRMPVRVRRIYAMSADTDYAIMRNRLSRQRAGLPVASLANY